MMTKKKMIIVAAALLAMVFCAAKMLPAGLFSQETPDTESSVYDAGDYHYHLIPAETAPVSEPPLGLSK